MKGSDGGYKLSELSGRGGSADAVVNVRCQKVAANVQPYKRWKVANTPEKQNLIQGRVHKHNDGRDGLGPGYVRNSKNKE